MADRYTDHIIRCLENSIENAVDGVECHISAVTVQHTIDLLKSQQAKIKKYELDKSWEDSPDRMNGCGW